MSRLVIYSSGIVNRTIDLTGQNIRIGRAKGNDVVLFDPGQVVSRFHAELRYEDGRYILLDLNSANGTWVLDHRIQRIVFETGTVAEIADYRLVLEAEAEETTVPPGSRRDFESRHLSVPKSVSGPLVISTVPASPEPVPSAGPTSRTGESQADVMTRAAAQAALAAGAGAERRGDLVGALREFQRALDADPDCGAGDALRRVRAQMKTLGDAAFEQAKTFDARSRTEDAIAQYERALQLLPPDDPDCTVARARLDTLRAPFIGHPSR